MEGNRAKLNICESAELHPGKHFILITLRGRDMSSQFKLEEALFGEVPQKSQLNRQKS